MLTIETAIRLIVIGQEILFAAIFLFGNGTRAARISGAALMLSVAGYLYGSDTNLRGAIPELLPAVMLMTMIAPYCLWAFARAVFESPWPKWWVTSAFLSVGLVVWAIFVAGEYGSHAMLCKDGMDAFEPVLCSVVRKAIALPEGFMEEDKRQPGVTI